MRYIHKENWRIQSRNLAPAQARGNKAINEVIYAVVERGDISPVVINAKWNSLDWILNALDQTIYEVQALVRSLLDRVGAAQATIQTFDVWLTSQYGKSCDEEEDDRKESGSAHLKGEWKARTKGKTVQGLRIWSSRTGSMVLYAKFLTLHIGIYSCMYLFPYLQGGQCNPLLTLQRCKQGNNTLNSKTQIGYMRVGVTNILP